jgi:hypothetical protein
MSLPGLTGLTQHDMEGNRQWGDPGGSRGSRPRPPRQPDEERAVDVIIRGSISPADVPRLWERICPLLQGGEAEVLVCDVNALVAPDAETVDALARLQLTAMRSGCRIRLRNACDGLTGLLALTGLAEVVPCSGELDVGLGGKAEQGEPALRVQEERDPGDPIL